MADDYYSLLGLEPSADSADIKAAYREKKAALDAKGDKNASAQLNKAWNVLSDPYQRGRYDATLDTYGTDREVVSGDDIEVVEDPEPPRRRGLFQPAPPRDRNAAKPAPTITPPPGTRFPEPRRRVIAMVIDLTILLIVFVGANLAAWQYNDSNHKAEKDRIAAIDDEIGDLDDQKDELNDQKDDLEQQAEDPPEGQADEIDAQIDDIDNEIEGIDDEIDGLQDEATDLDAKLNPAESAANGVAFGFGLLYLIVPSGLTGRTLGKKLQGIKVVRVDGSRLGWSGAFSRYGLLVIGTFLLSSFLLGPFAPAIALFIVLGWMRNPNQQSMLDRFAKTVVVTETSDV